MRKDILTRKEIVIFEKPKPIWLKLLLNLAVSLPIGSIIGFSGYCWGEYNWWMCGSFFSLFFVIFTFYEGIGKKRDITDNWPDWAKEIRNTFGYAFLYTLGVTFIGAILILILALTCKEFKVGKEMGNTMFWTLLSIVAVLYIFIVTCFLKDTYKILKKRFIIGAYGTLLYFAITILPFLFLGSRIYSSFQNPEQNTAVKETRLLHSSRHEINNSKPSFDPHKYIYVQEAFHNYFTYTPNRVKIINFSNDLLYALGVKIGYGGYEKEVGDYVIFEAQNSWNDNESILEVRPKDTKKAPLKDWYFQAEGNYVDILPPPSVQIKILNRINKQSLINQKSKFK